MPPTRSPRRRSTPMRRSAACIASTVALRSKICETTTARRPPSGSRSRRRPPRNKRSRYRSSDVTMILRRHFLTLVAISALFPLSVRAQGTDKASAFVKSTGDRLVAVVNGPGSATSKRAAMTQILNADVDVDGIGKFCLGRFWRQASPDQQKQYIALFHEVLVSNITSKLGDYKGVTFTMGRARPQDEEAVVSTTVVRPNNPPTAVD